MIDRETKDRETKDTETWTRQDMVLEWQEAKRPKGVGEGEMPTVYRKQHSGQLGWAFLIKCPRAVYTGLPVNDELEDYPWGGDIWLAMDKWQRWVRDWAIIITNKEITLTGNRFGLRTNEMLFVMLAMRSWGFESLNQGEAVEKRTWFAQMRAEALINWY
jgi:hypothetical protein